MVFPDEFMCCVFRSKWLRIALKNSNYMGNKLLLMLSYFNNNFYCIDMVMNLHIMWSSIHKRAVWRVLVTCTNERRN